MTSGQLKYFLIIYTFVFFAAPTLADARETSVAGSLKDECTKTFKEVEDMFKYHNTLEVLGNVWGEELDRAMIFLDWCVKHELIKIK